MSPTFGEHFTSELPRTPCLRTSENLPSRDCLKIPNGPHRGLLREGGTGLKALFRSLECHQIPALKRPLAIFQTVSLGTWVNKGERMRCGENAGRDEGSVPIMGTTL